MKLWLDNRNPPPNDWVWVKDPAQFDQFFKMNETTHISFSDDNAGPGRIKEWMVAKWLLNAIENKQITRIPTVSFHGRTSALIPGYIRKIKEFTKLGAFPPPKAQ